MSATNPATSPATNMDLLRFATAGSVDDGKSTLIGRLLLDSKSIFEDQLEAESIHIFREVAAEFEKPVLMFSGG